jgi:HEAT repeat protein
MPVRRHVWMLVLLALPFMAGSGGAKPNRIHELQKQLRHAMTPMRVDAIRELQQIGTDKAVDVLAGRVRDERNWEVQIRILEALDALGNRRALDSLARLSLEGEVILVRRAAVKALKNCDDGSAMKRVKSGLTPRDDEGRRRAMEALAVIGTEDALRLIILHFGDRDEDVKAAAARAVGQIGNPAGIGALLKLRRQRDPLVRTHAILALARFDHEDVHPVLVQEVVKAHDEYIVRRIVPAVARFESEGIVDAIEAKWAKLKGLQKARVCRMLGAIASDRCVNLLMPALTHRDVIVRADAARALGVAGQARAITPLLRSLEDKADVVRLMAVRSLRKLLPADRRLELVRLALANSSVEIRVAGCVLAADDRLKEALPEVIETVQAKSWEVSTAAMISVGLLGHANETDVFTPFLRNRDWRLRATAVEGLFLLRHNSVIPPLIDMISDPHANVRSAAVKSLQVLTQQRLGAEPDKWRRWLEANKGAFEITKKGSVVAGGDKDRYAKDKYLIEILKKAQLLVVLGKWDKVQLILDDLKIPHTLIRVQKLKTIGLNPKQLILFNCEGGGGVDKESTEALRWFVNTGGYVITTDWALQNVVKDVWPGLMVKWEKNTTRNDAVAIEPAAPDDPILKGVFDRGLPLKWWLEIQAFAIEILDPFRVDVLVDSLEMMDRYTLSAMLARFSYGHGKVLNSVSHFYLQKEGLSNVNTERERMIFAADNLGLGFREINDLANRGFFKTADAAATKVTKDYSMFRLIVNFVNEKKRRVEQE